MIELFEWPPTRSQRAKWVLEELGVPYKSSDVNLLQNEQQGEPYRKIQPLGVVPALKTPNYSMFESVAIVLQLIDECPEKKLAPSVGSAERAMYYQWCVFAGTEMDPAIMLYFNNSMRPSGPKHDPKLAERGRDDFKIRAEILSNTLKAREYLLGNSFSGADILIGHSCFMARHVGLMDQYPILDSYHNRLQKRPAYQRAYEGYLI